MIRDSKEMLLIVRSSLFQVLGVHKLLFSISASEKLSQSYQDEPPWLWIVLSFTQKYYSKNSSRNYSSRVPRNSAILLLTPCTMYWWKYLYLKNLCRARVFSKSLWTINKCLDMHRTNAPIFWSYISFIVIGILC